MGEEQEEKEEKEKEKKEKSYNNSSFSLDKIVVAIAVYNSSVGNFVIFYNIYNVVLMAV